MTPLRSDDGTASAAARITAAVRAAQGSSPTSTPANALAAVSTLDVSHFLHPRFDADVDLEPLCSGIAASPGAASGRIVLGAEEAIAASANGDPAILVRTETTPEDVVGMQAAKGIITARGGLVSHAAVVARGWGIPAVVGVDSMIVDDAGVVLGNRRFASGEVISIDGQSGKVFAGAAALDTAAAPPELTTLLRWADAVRAGRFAIRANADNAADAARARFLGAEGIGLCRTEHMFLAPDRLPLVRRLILSEDPSEDEAALAALEEVQQRDFYALLSTMDGMPVAVRLLDPPLHEFLPELEPLLIAEGTGSIDHLGRAELSAIRRLRETNPMIGTRGVRLGLLKPGLYPMQVRAVCRAAALLTSAGGSPIVEVMIPMVIDASELEVARGWILGAETAVGASGTARRAISVGTMIETPRAALVASSLAGVADFFSLGTNDLTQLTFAFSRDDVETKLLPHYLNAGLLATNPFEVLDESSVGYLVRHAVREGRAASPGLKIGACGEQAGDPASVRFLVASGLDYVSCSPYRLPAARLAVAQALLDLGIVDPAAACVEEIVDAATLAPRQTTADGAFRVIHALKIKGLVDADTLAEVAAVPEDFVEEELTRLLDAGLCRYLEARGLWQLTPAGVAAHKRQLPGAPPEDIALLREVYERFLEVNVAFKRLCNAWQVRDDALNDHLDIDYDRTCVGRLVAHHDAADEILAGMESAVGRLRTYRPRLDTAVAAVTGGDTSRFAGVMKRSYHDVWMELHEDLITVLGIDRAAEGSL
jgi:pyruvate,orthophosphate dikinase